MKKKRISPQQSQEFISRNAFAELLENHGWNTASISPDIGEDFLIRIFDNGVSTGLSLYIQLKSAENIKNYQLKSGKISYQFEVSDLEYWEAQSIPVLLAIWDMATRKAHYIWAVEAIKLLDSRNKKWRNNKKANVHFPPANIFTPETFIKLRIDLANHFFPLIGKDKDIPINAIFEFPNTPEGQDKRTEFEKHLASGDEVEIIAEFIKDINFPDWWTNLYGLPTVKKIKISPPQLENSPPQNFQFDFFSTYFGYKRLQNIELRLVKAGKEEITATNSYQDTPIKITLSYNKKTRTTKLFLTLEYNSIDGYQAMEAINIQQILSKEAEIRIKNLQDKNEDTLHVKEGQFPSPNESTLDFIKNVCFIQDTTGIILTFPEDGSYSVKDTKAAEELVSIFNTGKFKQTGMVFSLEFYRAGIETMLSNWKETEGNILSFRILSDDSYVDILNKRISLGPMTQFVRGRLDINYNTLARWVEDSSTEDIYKIVLNDTEIIQEFENWPRN